MFTGLIECMGRVAQLSRAGQDFMLRIESDLPVDELSLGDSVAVNGACLTVTRLSGGGFSAQVSPETLRRTNLGALKPGDAVNLERALALGGRLGGHLVLGHVDGTGRIVGREKEGNAIHFRVEVPSELEPYLVEKGSVTLDGISLTLNALEGRVLGVTLVPFTRTKVALLDRPTTWRVNVEVDILGKYVARLLRKGKLPEPLDTQEGDGVTLDLLARGGFLG